VPLFAARQAVAPGCPSTASYEAVAHAGPARQTQCATVCRKASSAARLPEHCFLRSSGTRRAGSPNAVCHCLPQGKQCRVMANHRHCFLRSSGTRRPGSSNAVCHCLPQGKQWRPVAQALLLTKQWHTPARLVKRSVPLFAARQAVAPGCPSTASYEAVAHHQRFWRSSGELARGRYLSSMRRNWANR